MAASTQVRNRDVTRKEENSRRWDSPQRNRRVLSGARVQEVRRSSPETSVVNVACDSPMEFGLLSSVSFVARREGAKHNYMPKYAL